ncbi:hypothetical protein PPSIR1_24179 [Plesiocystis pacifica SIR-1]|uniref:SlyX protein n=1 Tax=Plesiocystis pacifica SIR-1 TaxID=391625 RepID=A6GC00_9BACT|nr:SlyX family protein [Plesiocystis pacifica]EDM76562.1 hypothetical protein PPSIR1_24179 [Plesiocystis pacifica SIR-1]
MSSTDEPKQADLEARVVELEIALSFERQTREALDEVVREFTARVEVLEARLSALGEQVRGTETDEVDDGSGYKFSG